MFNRIKRSFDPWAKDTMVLTSPRHFDEATNFIQKASYNPDTRRAKDRLALSGKMLFGADKQLPAGTQLKAIDFDTLKKTGNQRYPAFQAITPNGDEYVVFMTYKARNQDIGITMSSKSRETAQADTIYTVNDIAAFETGVDFVKVTKDTDISVALREHPISENKPSNNTLDITQGDVFTVGVTEGGLVFFEPAFEGKFDGVTVITNFGANASLEHMGLSEYSYLKEASQSLTAAEKRRGTVMITL